MHSSRTINYIVGGVLAGLALSLCLGYVSLIYAIHDGFRVAAYLFPYSVLLSPEMNSLSLVPIIVAFFQWPLYGAMLGIYLHKSRTTVLRLLIVYLLIQHIAVGTIAWTRVNSLPVKIIYSRS
jgi:hypothetical protein